MKIKNNERPSDFLERVVKNKIERLLEGYPIRAKGKTYQLGHYDGNDSTILLRKNEQEGTDIPWIPCEDISFGAFLDILEGK